MFTAIADSTIYVILLVRHILGFIDVIAIVEEIGLSDSADLVIGFHFDNDELYPAKFNNGARF